MNRINVLTSYGNRLMMLAHDRPDLPALTFISADGGEATTVSFRQLKQAATGFARALRWKGAHPGTLVVIDLPPGPHHVAATYGAWKLGATVLPLNAAAPDLERQAILQIASEYRPVVRATSVRPQAVPYHPEEDETAEGWWAAPIPDPGHLIASGGSTGRPKLIDFGAPGRLLLRDGQPPHTDDLSTAGLRPGQIHLICTPLHHTSGFTWLHGCLMRGDQVIVLEHFDADIFLDTVERYRVNHTILVPAIMQRLAARADIGQRDLSSLEAFWHGGAVCPPGLKRRWLHLVGPTRLWESFGATEGNGGTLIRGDEWLAHPGSVGRPTTHEILILDEQGHRLPPGQVGEIFFRPLDRSKPSFRYIGPDRPRLADDGFSSVGDLGWLDSDGYLYATDRRTDMIISGGSNVFAAEVEVALLEHPGIADAVVIGLPDESWGRRVHAICVPAHPGTPPTPAELKAWCRNRLADYKVPKEFEMVDTIARNEVGKINRQHLIDQRLDLVAR